MSDKTAMERVKSRYPNFWVSGSGVVWNNNSRILWLGNSIEDAASRLPRKEEEPTPLDWSQDGTEGFDEKVVRAAVPDAREAFDFGAEIVSRSMNDEILGRGYAGEDGKDYSLAWAEARQHPTVQAWEKANRPQATKTRPPWDIPKACVRLAEIFFELQSNPVTHDAWDWMDAECCLEIIRMSQAIPTPAQTFEEWWASFISHPGKTQKYVAEEAWKAARKS